MSEDIPDREKIIWENPELMASLQRGIEQASRGEVSELNLDALIGEDNE